MHWHRIGPTSWALQRPVKPHPYAMLHCSTWLWCATVYYQSTFTPAEDWVRPDSQYFTDEQAAKDWAFAVVSLS